MLLVACFAAAEASAEGQCAAWPGEPQPLPTVVSDDPAGARWAELRAAELTRFAANLETQRPLDARQVWKHIACLDPENETARNGLTRTQPVRVHRPEVALTRSRATTSTRQTSLAQAFASLHETVAVYAPPPKPSRPAPKRLDAAGQAQVTKLIERAEGMLRQARFEEALSPLQQARESLAPYERNQNVRSLLARLEVTAGSAQIALGRQADAARSFRRALQADPELSLDPMTTSPKIRRAFEAVREGNSP